MPEHPFAHVLHRAALERMADPRTLERGERYAREGRVGDLEVRAGFLGARVHGTATYAAKLWVRDDGLAYACSCPVGGEGGFCKHLVATALLHLAGAAARGPNAPPGDAASLDALARALAGIAPAELSRRLLARAAIDARFLRELCELCAAPTVLR